MGWRALLHAIQGKVVVERSPRNGIARSDRAAFFVDKNLVGSVVGAPHHKGVKRNQCAIWNAIFARIFGVALKHWVASCAIHVDFVAIVVPVNELKFYYESTVVVKRNFTNVLHNQLSNKVKNLPGLTRSASRPTLLRIFGLLLLPEQTWPDAHWANFVRGFCLEF